MSYRERGFREQRKGSGFILRIPQWICCLDSVDDNAFVGNIDIKLVGLQACFDHEVWRLGADLDGGYSSGRGRLNEADRVQGIFSCSARVQRNGRRIQPSDGPLRPGRDMSGFIASLLVEGTHVLVGGILPSEIKQVGKIAQVSLVQDLAHPVAEIIGHAEPRPGEIRKLRGRTAAGPTEHHDRCADKALGSQLGAHCRLESVGRNVLFRDGLCRQHNHIEIRQSGRYSVEIGADGSVGAGYRVAGCRVCGRVEKQSLHNLTGPIRRYDIRRLDVCPRQRNESEFLST